MYVERIGAGIFLAATIVFGASSALASESISYAYDALGRLTNSASSGSVNNGISTAINYDAAGNRSNYNVTGAPSGLDGGGATARSSTTNSLATASTGTASKSSALPLPAPETGPRPFVDDIPAAPPR
jgi:hypothetical protein